MPAPISISVARGSLTRSLIASTAPGVLRVTSTARHPAGTTASTTGRITERRLAHHRDDANGAR